MAIEIEHKYLVISDQYKLMSELKSEISQGYLSRTPSRTVRVRIKDDKGFLTVKGITEHDSRMEFEYQIPKTDAEEMMAFCECVPLQKTRYIVNYCGNRWEVDEFHGKLEGLVLAEIELKHSGEHYELPPFVGKNVTGDPKYYNSALNGVCEEH